MPIEDSRDFAPADLFWQFFSVLIKKEGQSSNDDCPFKITVGFSFAASFDESFSLKAFDP